MNKNSLAIPAAIVIAAAFIAGAIYLSNTRTISDTAAVSDAVSADEENQDVVVAPVSEEDHIRGNPNAPIVLVEYSDYDCPFCKDFHNTMRQVMSEYGEEGKVAWVYRHFPLPQLHPNAPLLAAASECVAEQGGNASFWSFSDQIFEGRETNGATDISLLPQFAEQAGVDKDQFSECLSSGKYNQTIQEDLEAAIAAGGRGTPHTIVLVGDQQGVISGAQPYSTVKQIIESLLLQIEGQDS